MTEQMVLNESEIECLLEIADGNQKERSFGEPQAGQETTSPLSRLLDGKDGMKIVEVIKTIEKSRKRKVPVNQDTGRIIKKSLCYHRIDRS